MDTDTDQTMRQVNALVDEYRVRCLWYLREDYYPETIPEACRVLDAIARHGDVPQGSKVTPMALTEFQRTICRLIRGI